MAFSEIDRINLVTKSLVAGVIDANSVSQWYESIFPFTFMLNSDKILTELNTVRQYPASTISQARANALAIPDLLQDLSLAENAVRLTEVLDTNGTTWAAYSTYNDYSSSVLNNWMQPQLVPQSNGLPSNGYGILLYDGDPNNGGSGPISTTAYMAGQGVNRSVSWFWNYSNGMLLVSEDFLQSRPNFDPYIQGFRYSGNTVQNITSELEVLTEDLANLETSFNQHKVDVQAQIDNILANATNITLTNTGSGIALGSASGGDVTLKTLSAGDHVSLSEEADGSVKISVSGGGRTGMISRFVKGG